MERLIKKGDVLDEPADALIYSTNVKLNCSGGVGAVLVARYGQRVQDDLRDIRDERGRRHVEPGTVIEHVTEGMPYRRVFHTVPVDGWYETSPEIVENVLRRCLEVCAADPGVASVALSALATGYGNLTLKDFLTTAAMVLNDSAYDDIDRIVIRITGPRFEEAVELITTESLALETRVLDSE